MKFDKVGKIEILTFLPISCDLQLDKVGAVINQHRGTVETGNSKLFKTCCFIQYYALIENLRIP